MWPLDECDDRCHDRYPIPPLQGIRESNDKTEKSDEDGERAMAAHYENPGKGHPEYKVSGLAEGFVHRTHCIETPFIIIYRIN